MVDKDSIPARTGASAHHVVLVTGSSRGLGRAVASDLADRGAAVCFHGRTASSELQAEMEQRRTRGQRVAFHAFDVTDVEQTNAAIEAVERDLGPLTACIAAASAYATTRLDALTPEQWQTLLQTTLTGTFLTSQAVLPRLRRRRYGRLVLLGCVGCDRIYHGTTAVPYRIAVSGNLALTKAYAQLAAPDGVTVNLLAPGFLENTIDAIDPARLPNGRLTRFDELLPAIHFLLSDAATAVNGACLTVSNGYVT